MQDPLRFMVIPFILPIIRAARRTSEVHHGRGRISTLGVCEVVASERSGYVAGDIVLAPTGWRTPPTLIAARRGQQGAGPSKFPVLKIPFPVIASRGSERSGVYHINHILSDSSCARGPRRPARAAGAAAAASSSRSMEFGRSSPSRSAAQAALDSNQLRGHRQQIGQSAALTVGALALARAALRHWLWSRARPARAAWAVAAAAGRTMVRSPAAPVLFSFPSGLAGPAAHETLPFCGHVVGIEVGIRLVRLSPLFSWTRGSWSTSDCRHGPSSAPEHAS